jgi:hypothetical protein
MSLRVAEPARRFRLAERADDIEVERFAERAGLLGAVQHGDGFHALGQRGGEILHRERTIEADFHHAGLSRRCALSAPTVSPTASAPEPMMTITRSASGAPS